MSISGLTEILRPPFSPVDRPDTDKQWRVVEETIGSSLPQDYKDFIRTYGSGSIDRFISIYNPFAKNEHLNLLDSIRIKLDVLRELQAEAQEFRKYRLYPDSDGLLPVGGTSNGDVIFWLMRGQPDSWPIVINESRAPDFELFPYNLTTLLTLLLTRKTRCGIFPTSFPNRSPQFNPPPPLPNQV